MSGTSTSAPDIECPDCHGLGRAWQWRTYGDRQYHGEYWERCDACGGTGRIPAPAPTQDNT